MLELLPSTRDVDALVVPYIYAESAALEKKIIEMLSESEPRISAPISGRRSVTSDVSSDEEGTATRPVVSRRAIAKGECCQCKTRGTPQWRYVHRYRLCNACYMRVKRLCEQTWPGRKLPPRAKGLLPPEEDTKLGNLAAELVANAFNEFVAE